MRVKKYLREQGEKEAEQLLTEGDRAFCQSLVEQVKEPVKKPRVKMWAALSSALAVCVTLAVVLPVVLSNRSPKVYYRDENVLSQESTLANLQADVKYFSIVGFDEAQEVTVSLNYDSISNDKLYYSLNARFDSNNIAIDVVVNKNYQYKFETGNTPITQQLVNYSVTYYYEENESFLPNIKSAEYRGEIKLKTETVYFDYRQAIAQGDAVFFQDIQSYIQTKGE